MVVFVPSTYIQPSLITLYLILILVTSLFVDLYIQLTTKPLCSEDLSKCLLV